MGNLGFSALLFSVIGIVGAIMVHKRGKLGGLLMIVASVCGFISVFMGYIIASILLLIGGIISIKKPDQNPKKTKWIIYIPVLLVLSIIIFVVSLNTSGDAAVTSSDNETKYIMGDEVQVGDIKYLVNSVTSSKLILDEFFDYSTEGIFLTTDITVTNAGKEEVIIDSSMFKIVESDGTTYDPSSEHNSMDLFLDSLNPKMKNEYKVIFELPVESQDYMLQVSNGIFGLKTANIKLVIESSNNASSTTPIPSQPVTDANEATEENSEIADTTNSVAVADTTENEQTEDIFNEGGPLASEVEDVEDDSASPVFYKTVTAYIENSYYFQDGYILEWAEDGYYRYGYIPNTDVDYTNLIVEMECENSGKTFSDGLENVNYSDITSIEIETIKADEYFDYDIAYDDAQAILEDMYLDYNITYISENDFGSEMGFWYFFSMIYGDSDAEYCVFVKKDTGEIYSAYFNGAFYEPDSIIQ